MADGYVITAQAPILARTEDGTVGDAMQITFRTRPSDVISKVAIPIAHYTRDEVDRIVTAAAKTIEEVAAL